ncbi:MAG: glycosyltransferase [Clostridia bacterium]|nr:glycosyltransferase [Clostridia bacterium]
MKKLLFAAYDMSVGGIETALLTLLNYLADKDYKITLVLERKQGIFLKDLNTKINVVEYKPASIRFLPIRKFINSIKRLKFIIKYKNKFDFSASFATYSKVASFTSRTASKNCALWGHADYFELFRQNKNEMKDFFEGIKYDEFKTIIFVSKKACNTFIEVFPQMKNKVVFCNNLINYKKIQNMSKEETDYKKDKYTFINVGRHDETQKKLTRIIEAAEMLKEDNLDFKILFVGEGKDTSKYKKIANRSELRDNVEFLGVKKNPYPYIKLADAVILTSDYEGYPVVFLEALILNKPIITTDVADAVDDINDKFGKVVKKDENDIYMAMKEFITKGYEIKEQFNPEEYNNDIIKKLESIFNEY